jgi:hypothetical protein
LVPSEWYSKRSERDLISLLKSELSRGGRDSAAAMVLDLLLFPKTWEDLAFEEEAYMLDFGDLGPQDEELSALVRQAFPTVILPVNARLLDCCKAILIGALGRPAGELRSPSSTARRSRLH